MIKRFFEVLKSLVRSTEQAVISDPEVKSLVTKYPRFFTFLKKRFDGSKFSGWPLTILLIVFLYVVFSLAGVTEDIINSDLIIAVDTRVANLLYFFRNPIALQFFFWVTVLGKPAMILIVAATFSLFLWLTRKKIYILILWLVIAGTEGFVFLGKLIFHRPRPVVAAYFETSASFPSAHAAIAVALYGFITYVLWRESRKRSNKIFIVATGLILILLIGFSRLYLGVHFVSDIWAGYLIGLLWLIVGVGVLGWFAPRQEPATSRPKAGLIMGSLLVVVVVGLYLIVGWYYSGQFRSVVSVGQNQEVAAVASDIFTIYNLNKYTETLSGQSQEPLSFIIISSGANFLGDFQRAGWSLADRVSLGSLWHLGKSAFRNQDYPTAPMTPSFWNGQVHDFGWEKDTDQHSSRQRHHARFWQTNFKTSDGRLIYVGTASLDTGIKWLITHKISPDIDTEREFIFQDLQASGAIASFRKEKFVSPVLGQNFSGDPFFTDGEVYILDLK